MEWLKHSLNDIVSLFFPNLCLACGENLPPKQEMISGTANQKFQTPTSPSSILSNASHKSFFV